MTRAIDRASDFSENLQNRGGGRGCAPHKRSWLEPTLYTMMDLISDPVNSELLKQQIKYRVWNVTRGSSLGDSIELADTSAKRRKGLLGIVGLRLGEGLWIVPCEAVHCFFMKFPIDVLYLDRRQRVRKAVAGLAPWRLSMCLPAHSVLELPAGTIARTSTQKGDELEIRPV